MSKKFRLLMVLVLVTGMLGGLLTSSTVSADPTPGTVIEIPRIDVDDVFGTGDWDTQIQIQNVGAASTFVTVEFWGGWSELCPTNSPGSFYDVQQWLPVGGIWTLHSAIPAGAESAFIYSDELVAVTVDRWGPDPFGEFQISSSYTGIADPWMAGDMVFAPYVMHGYNDLDTTFTIQNSGDLCTSVWIYYKEEGNCEFMKAQHIELLAPGESIRIGPGSDADVGFPSPEINAPWLGSAYISANEPLAVVVDQLSLTGANRGTLLSMRGMPYDQRLEMTWYADLLYREISGYSSSIQVQNITRSSMPTFVTVEFFDQSGDHILYVGEWICRNGTATFYLPAIVDLGVNFPFGYVGAAEIQSHGQIDYPGDYHDGEPIFAVVDVKKTKVYDEALPGWRHTVAGETQGGAYNAHPEHQKTNAWGWAMPYIAKEQEGVTSRIVIRNNANCNKIEGDIFIRDETGRVVAQIPVGWLHPKHMKVIDLAYFGQIARGFVGAATFEVDGVEQLCDDDRDGHTDNLPVMPSVVVLNYGYAKELPIGGGAGPQTTEGDLTRIYEAIPFAYGGWVCYGDIFGTVAWYDFDAGVPNPEANEPLVGADVVAAKEDPDVTDVTSYAGGYELIRVSSEITQTVTASKSGFWTQSEDVWLDCGADTQLDILLVCEGTLTGVITDTATSVPLAGVLVELDITSTTLPGHGPWDLETTTNASGVWSLTVPLVGSASTADAPWTLKMSLAGYDDRDYAGTSFAANHTYVTDDCFDGNATRDFYRTPLISKAYIQGRVFCDGLVSDNNAYNPGEEQAGVLVRLYKETSTVPAKPGEVWEQSFTTLTDGLYQFTVSLDRNFDGTIDAQHYTVVAHPTEETAFTITADEHRVVNIDICK